MSRRSYTRSDQTDDDYKYRVRIKKSDRSRSPPIVRSSYGITSETYSETKHTDSKSHRPVLPLPPRTSSKSNGFIPDEETKKYYEKPTSDDTGFWTSEDYTFRDTIAEDIRAEIEDDIASKGSDEESEEDPELAEYAERADMDDEDEVQKKTIIERMIPCKRDDEKKKDIKTTQALTKEKTLSTYRP